MKARKFLLWIISLIVIIVLFFIAMILFSVLQEQLFLPQDYIMWTFNYPLSRLVFIFEFYLIVALFFRKILRSFVFYAKRNKKWFYPTFLFANLLLVYTLIFNVSVITKNYIIDHSFFSPEGKVYRYGDIASINTGVYGKKFYFPFTHSSGEFYYIINFKNGKTINLNDSVGGTKNDQDVYEIFEKIDKDLVNRGIKKISNSDNFELLEKGLDRVYSDRLKNVINNIK